MIGTVFCTEKEVRNLEHYTWYMVIGCGRSGP